MADEIDGPRVFTSVSLTRGWRHLNLNRYLVICGAASIAAITGLWIFFFASYSTRGLPLGWDTPYYLWRLQSAALGINSFLINQHYYDFLYPTLGSWFVLAGLAPTSIEVFLPFSLWMVGVGLIFSIVRREITDPKATLIAVSSGSTWFGLFRLGSDLHANLLGLVLMLAGTWLFLHAEDEVERGRFAVMTGGLVGIILLSSLAHTETTIFISAVWLLALTLGWWRGLVNKARFIGMFVMIFVSLIPGTLIFYFQQQWTAAPLQGRLPAIPAMPPAVWLLYLAPTGIGVVVAVPVLYYLRRLRFSSRIIVLSISWLAFSLGIGLAQYLNQSITPFSERAIILTPTPFLASILIPRLGLRRLTDQIKGVALISLIIIGGSGVYFAVIGNQFYNSFISDSAASSLQYLHESKTIDPKTTVFIFSDSPDHRGYGDHNNAWVGFFLGDHYSYLGRIDFLMAGLATPFADDQSTQVSRIFLSNLPIDQVRNMTILFLSDFNYPDPPPSFYQGFLTRLSENVYRVDQADWNPGLVVIPAYSSVLSPSAGWSSVARTWARSGSSLEFNSTSPSEPATMSVAFAAPQQGFYNITMRLWDEPISSPVSVSLDGIPIYTLRYSGTSASTFMPINASVFSGGLSAGVHTLTVSIADQPAIPQYMSLDTIAISET